MAYPSWSYFPSNTRPPDWVSDLVGVVSTCETGVSSNRADGAVSSDAVLAELTPGLQALGYIVETGKRADQKVSRPVLFGENGKATVTYDVDAAHEALGIVVEVEAGRGARNTAAYRTRSWRPTARRWSSCGPSMPADACSCLSKGCCWWATDPLPPQSGRWHASALGHHEAHSSRPTLPSCALPTPAAMSV